MAEEEKGFKHIVRISNTDLEGKKAISDSLRKIKGVGFMFSNMICKVISLDKKKKTGDLSSEEIGKIEAVLKNPLSYKAPVWMLNRRRDCDTGDDVHLVGGDIGFVQGNDIKMLKMIKSYKGVRHMAGLPARGQKTRSNFRKNKGKVLGVKRSAGAKAGKV